MKICFKREEFIRLHILYVKYIQSFVYRAVGEQLWSSLDESRRVPLSVKGNECTRIGLIPVSGKGFIAKP